MLDVVHRAAPPRQADDVPVGVREEIVGKVRPHHPRDARDERARRHDRSFHISCIGFEVDVDAEASARIENSIFHDSTGTEGPSSV